VDALPHEHSNLEVDTLTDSKPVELSQDRSDVFSTGRAANQTSSGVLDGLKALQVVTDLALQVVTAALWLVYRTLVYRT